MEGERGFLYRKFWLPLLGQMKQGTTPDRIAWSVSAGVTVALFPILGATTLLGAAAGVIFRLNHVTIQAVNYLATPLQLAAIPVLVKMGETVFGLPHISFNPLRLANEFNTAPKLFLMTYGASGLAGIAVWAVLAPIVLFSFHALFLPILRKKIQGPA